MGDLLSVVKELWGLRDRWRSAKKDRREQVAAYFEGISGCLKTIAVAVEQGLTPPLDACAELSVYATNLPDLVSDVLQPDELERVSGQVSQASMARGMLHDMATIAQRSPAARVEQVAVIAQTSGLFRGLAANLRVTG